MPSRRLHWHTFLSFSFILIFLLINSRAEGKKPQNGTGNAGSFDHRSHAVPGKDRVVKDFDGDGFEEVELNGGLSHSHYFRADPPEVGKIVEYEWKENRHGRIIGKRMVLRHKFPVGVTVVTLRVTDNTNDTSSANVTITVQPSWTEGAYLYYYDMQEVSTHKEASVALHGLDSQKITPVFGTRVESVDFVKKNQWPKFPDTLSGSFAVRTVTSFLASPGETYSLFVGYSKGVIDINVGGKRIISNSSESAGIQVAIIDSTYLKERKNPLDIRFFTQDPINPLLMFGIRLNNTISAVAKESLTFEAGSVLPTIHKASPIKSTLGGGGVMTIEGAGFIGKTSIMIGPYKAKEVKRKSEHVIVLKIPTSTASQEVLVTAKTAQGTSNAIPFSYNKAAPMPIKFKRSYVKYRNGTIFPSSQFTSVALGPDLRYYFGSLDSRVHVAAIEHETMLVVETCKSESMGKGRSITGVAFNPAEKSLRVYVSTNLFYWRNYFNIPDPSGWHNGKIQALKRGQNQEGDCLVLEKDVVVGLPVSNHDHGVNSLIFDNDGNLYIQIGGSTNAGVSKSDDLIGGVKESVLSSATVVAHLQHPWFSGIVTYDEYNNPETANKTLSDSFVEPFAFGFRNSYGSVFHSNGYIFATDNGPNKGYGPRSLSCTTEGPDVWHPDSLVLVQKGAYFGYPNRARGMRGDSRQCQYYAPNELAREGFTPALATFEASTNGIIEYTANCFESQMKGDLLISKYAVQGKGKLFRAQLDATGKALKGKVTELADFSGLSLVMNPLGMIVMPRVQQPNIAVLIPEEEEYPGNNPHLTSVTPNRGPKSGGNIVLLTGKKLAKLVSVKFNNNPCTVLRVSTKGDWAICIVPAGKGPAKVTLETADGVRDPVLPDYFYMSY